MRLGRVLLGILVVAGSPLLLPACRGDEEVLEPKASNVTVRMTNTSAAIVHMFAGDETFPCCQLPSGGSRTKLFTLTMNQFVSFKVGQNGTILKEQVCAYGHTPEEEVTEVYVRWDGVSLICAANW